MKVSLVISALLLASASCSSTPQDQSPRSKPLADDAVPRDGGSLPAPGHYDSIRNVIREFACNWDHLHTLAYIVGGVLCRAQFSSALPKDVQMSILQWCIYTALSVSAPTHFLLVHGRIPSGHFPLYSFPAATKTGRFIKASLTHHGFHTVSRLVTTAIMLFSVFPISKMLSFVLYAVASFYLANNLNTDRLLDSGTAYLLMIWLAFVSMSV